MADKSITQLTSYTTPISTDVIPIVDVSNTVTKKIAWGLLAQAGTSFSPGFTGFSADPTMICNYQLVGKLCFIQMATTGDGTSNATGFTITGLPFTAAASSQVGFQFSGYGKDNSAVTNFTANISGGTTLTLCKGNSFTAASWTSSGGKSANLNFFYEII